MTHLFHIWPKWSAPKQVRMVERHPGELDSPWKERTITIQERSCTICGLYEARRVIIQ